MSDSSYLEQIRQLVELQKVDDEIFAVKCKQEEAPRAVRELAEKFSDAEKRRAHIVEKLEHLTEQKKRISLEMDDDTARIRKSKDKLMQAATGREYQGMMREIDSMEKLSRTREEEKTTILEEWNLQSEKLREMDEEYEGIKAEYEVKRDGLEQEMAEYQAQLNALNAKREVASQFIPRPKFMRYEFIRERLEHPVIVPVDEGICSGCHIAIPPQTFIELQAGQQILNCPNCQRLIYWSDHFGEGKKKEPEPKPAVQEFFEDLIDMSDEE